MALQNTNMKLIKKSSSTKRNSINYKTEGRFGDTTISTWPVDALAHSLFDIHFVQLPPHEHPLLACCAVQTSPRVEHKLGQMILKKH